MTLFLFLFHGGLLALIGANYLYLRMARSAPPSNARVPRISVLVPARNEAANLNACCHRCVSKTIQTLR